MAQQRRRAVDGGNPFEEDGWSWKESSSSDSGNLPQRSPQQQQQQVVARPHRPPPPAPPSASRERANPLTQDGQAIAAAFRTYNPFSGPDDHDTPLQVDSFGSSTGGGGSFTAARATTSAPPLPDASPSKTQFPRTKNPFQRSAFSNEAVATTNVGTLTFGDAGQANVSSQAERGDRLSPTTSAVRQHQDSAVFRSGANLAGDDGSLSTSQRVRCEGVAPRRPPPPPPPPLLTATTEGGRPQQTQQQGNDATGLVRAESLSDAALQGVASPLGVSGVTPRRAAPPPPRGRHTLDRSTSAQPFSGNAVVDLGKMSTRSHSSLFSNRLPSGLLESPHSGKNVFASDSESSSVFTDVPPTTTAEPSTEIHAAVRLPPLQPEKAPALKFISTCNGCLFAGPLRDGSALLQWGNIEDDFECPALGETATDEDWDSATSVVLKLPPDLSSKVTCICPLPLTGSLWTGHNSGLICYWTASSSSSPAELRHSWRAHSSGNVCDICVTPWGRLWTASKFGTIKIWSYAEGIPDTYPPLKIKELAKSQKTASRARYIALSSSGMYTWTATKSSICLWDSYDFFCLGTIKLSLVEDPSHQDETQGTDVYRSTRPFWSKDTEPTLDEESDDDEGDSKAWQKAKKGVGIAGHVLRKFGKKVRQNYLENNSDDVTDPTDRYGDIKALVSGWDDCIWVAFKKGLLHKYSASGRMKNQTATFGTGICSLCLVGHWLWVGCLDGRLFTLDSTGTVVSSWRAHVFPVVNLTSMGDRVFSLGRDGRILVWSAVPTSDPQRRQWHSRLNNCLEPHQLTLLCGTWNVAESRPSKSSLQCWLTNRTKNVDIIALGLQETEMGTGSVASHAVHNVFNPSKLKAGNINAKLWANAILDVIGGAKGWRKVGLRQMAGILVMLFCQEHLVKYVGEMTSASVACGVMGVGGNKGAAAISFTVFRRRVLVISSHFTAHQENVKQRNQDYAKIVRRLQFHGSVKKAPEGEGTEDAITLSKQSTEELLEAEDELVWGPGIQDAEMLLWMGDLNYRIDAEYEDVLGKIRKRDLSSLLSKDQCLKQMARGAIFQGMQELPITFLPTYKFQKGVIFSAEEPPFDNSEKRRTPAWTDRILFCGSGALKREDNFAPNLETVILTPCHTQSYNACFEITDSDHKPVYALLKAHVPGYNQAQRRNVSLQALQEVASSRQLEANAPSVSVQMLSLKPSQSAVFNITNNGSTPTAFYIISQTNSTKRAGMRSQGLPVWLEVFPMSGILLPRAQSTVHVQTSARQFGPLNEVLSVQLSVFMVRGDRAPTSAISNTKSVQRLDPMNSRPLPFCESIVVQVKSN